MVHAARVFGFVLLAASASAPFQCAKSVDPEERREEGPAEALYALAERFKADGDHRARAGTLRFIAARYPSSRFAGMARDDLLRSPELQPYADPGPASAPAGAAPGDVPGPAPR